MNSRYQLLSNMGIQCWIRRELRDKVPVLTDLQSNPDVQVQQNFTGTGERWKDLQQQVSSCQRCSLYKTRSQTVFGIGNTHAEWMIVGEAPGAEEDRQGEPFVGRAGKLLNSMLFAAGFKRDQVYIANILKCRPPNNRDPLDEEIVECEPFLIKQLDLVQPKIILALGRVAAQNLLKTDTSIGRLRGKEYRYSDCPVVVTYHPAYLLRSPKAKKMAWDDIKMAINIVQRKC